MILGLIAMSALVSMLVLCCAVVLSDKGDIAPRCGCGEFTYNCDCSDLFDNDL